jgi:hypothetical protein
MLMSVNKALTLMRMTPIEESRMDARGDCTGAGPRPDPDRASVVEGSGGSVIARVARFGLAAGCVLALSACVTPQERRAMDQRQCYAFGFEAGTDGFAECMMGLNQQRTRIEADRDLQLRTQLAEQNRRRDAQHDLYKILSLQRSGDRAFPVCGASSEGGMDRRTMTWYGPSCRSR